MLHNKGRYLLSKPNIQYKQPLEHSDTTVYQNMSVNRRPVCLSTDIVTNTRHERAM